MNANWNNDIACIEEKTRYAQQLLDRHADTMDLAEFGYDVEELGSKYEVDELS